MTLDPELVQILVCPNDRGEIDYREDEQGIVCRTCGYRYPVRDDIPVMLIDEAENACPLPASIATPQRRSRRSIRASGSAPSPRSRSTSRRATHPAWRRAACPR